MIRTSPAHCNEASKRDDISLGLHRPWLRLSSLALAANDLYSIQRVCVRVSNRRCVLVLHETIRYKMLLLLLLLLKLLEVIIYVQKKSVA